MRAEKVAYPVGQEQAFNQIGQSATISFDQFAAPMSPAEHEAALSDLSEHYPQLAEYESQAQAFLNARLPTDPALLAEIQLGFVPVNMGSMGDEVRRRNEEERRQQEQYRQQRDHESRQEEAQRERAQQELRQREPQILETLRKKLENVGAMRLLRELKDDVWKCGNLELGYASSRQDGYPFERSDSYIAYARLYYDYKDAQQVVLESHTSYGTISSPHGPVSEPTKWYYKVGWFRTETGIAVGSHLDGQEFLPVTMYDIRSMAHEDLASQINAVCGHLWKGDQKPLREQLIDSAYERHHSYISPLSTILGYPPEVVEVRGLPLDLEEQGRRNIQEKVDFFRRLFS